MTPTWQYLLFLCLSVTICEPAQAMAVCRLSVAKKQRDTTRLTDQVKSRGFSAQVATRIAARAPDVARNISSLGEAKTIYRGLRVEPSEIDFAAGSNRSELQRTSDIGNSDDVSFATAETVALRYAKKNWRAGIRTILRLKVPREYFRLQAMSTTEGYCRISQLKDMSVYTRSIGLVGVQSAGAPRRIMVKWIAFEQAVELGVFKKGFDAQKLFDELPASPGFEPGQ